MPFGDLRLGLLLTGRGLGALSGTIPPIEDQPPGDFDGFQTPPTIEVVEDSIVIRGKTKPGFIGKFVVPLGALISDRAYNVNFVADLSGLALGGSKAGFGFGMKVDNGFRLTLLQGNGLGGVNAVTVRGTPPNGWNKQTGHTTENGGAPTSGTQEEADIQLVTNSDGDAYDFRTSADDQDTWDDELLDQSLTPFADVDDVSQFGFAGWFSTDDAGDFEVTVTWTEESAVSDPDFASVVFLSGFEGVDGSTSNFSDDAGGHTIGGLGAAIHIESDQFKFGSTSLFSQNESRATVADSNDWDLSDTNGSPFTIEYWYWQNSTGGAFIPVNWLDTGFGSGVLIMHNATTMHVRFFTDAIGDVQWNTASFGFSSNTWMHICIEKNSSGKMRVYLDGVMKGTNTPANSTIRHGTSQLFINQAAPGGTSYIDELRITKGVARYDSDSGFTPPAAPFPRF